MDEATQALGQEHAVTLSLAGRLADALAAQVRAARGVPCLPPHAHAPSRVQGEADRAAALLHVIVRRSDELQAHDPPGADDAHCSLPLPLPLPRLLTPPPPSRRTAFAALLNNLGNLQRQLGAQQEALQSYRRALQCMSRAVGEQHRYTATLQCNYGAQPQRHPPRAAGASLPRHAATALITSGGDAGEARRVLLAAAATRVRAFGEHSGEAGASVCACAPPCARLC